MFEKKQNVYKEFKESSQEIQGIWEHIFSKKDKNMEEKIASASIKWNFSVVDKDDKKYLYYDGTIMVR